MNAKDESTDVTILAHDLPHSLIARNYSLLEMLEIDLFTDTTAILISIVPNSYYGMPRGQIHINLPPEHPIMSFETIERSIVLQFPDMSKIDPNSGFSIRAGGWQNSAAIGREIAAYFSLEITPNFTNNIRNIGTEDKPRIRKDFLMKKTKDAR